ncbi:MAG TPA: 1-acyl-sn-glycerol-3-phosphate acyltransferase [Syntrophales bacterium]|nr:1-acyl-sn-glycerol-3-phosphate acyltransferase [Syntrophales bacterium]
MSFQLKLKIKTWMTESRKFFSGCIYKDDNFPLFWLIKDMLAEVELADEYVDSLKKLSENGIVIYAIKDKSQLNSLIIRELSAKSGIPWPVYCHGINMLFWQPFSAALRAVFSILFYFPFKKTILETYKADYLKRILMEGKSVVIHLGGSEFFENRMTQRAFIQLIETQKTLNKPVYIIPVMITYGRRRDKEKESLINILFGQAEETGALRRVITFLRYSNQATVITADPVKLNDFVNENKDTTTEVISHNLRRELIDRIDEEKTSIVGPVLKSREEFINMVLNEDSLNNFIEEAAAHGTKEHDALLREAKKYAREIAADYNDMFINVWDKFLTWLWNNIYDGVMVDKSGLAKIRNISKKMPFVIIPCHRSHIDYLLLSYVFFKNNIQLPFVAAGTNLSFWPLGYIFRKSGAFFIRRTFKGNILYGEVFAKYVEVLLKEGLPLEFFIEGGRSRSGKMVMPKFGLLSMLIQAFKRKACEDLAAIPVFIGYDRVIEADSYLKELGGVPKEREKTSDVIRSHKILRRRYGRVYMNIGEPIFLKSYLASQEKAFEDMTTDERQSLYRKISYEIALEINKVSVITPFSLVSLGLLCHDRKGISHDDLMDVLELFYDYLSHREVNFAATLARRDKAVIDALDQFDQSGIISKIGADEDEQDEIDEVVYSLEDDNRLKLEYYKNNILHFFIPIGFVAASLLSSDEDVIPLNRIIKDYQFFKRLFWNEFIFDDRKDDLDEVNDVLSYLNNKGMINGFEQDGQALVEVKGRGRVNLMPFAGLIRNYMESYWVVIRSCLYLRKGAMQEKDWIKKIQRLAVKMYKKGEIRRAEALSQSNYQSAIQFLQDAEIVYVSESGDKGDKKEFNLQMLASSKVEMDSIRHRLFEFL